MKKILGLALGSVVAAVAAPSLAQAQNAYTTEYVNLRAGPGLEYPIVFAVQPGQPLESYGCLNDWSWCDVSIDGYRGWMAGEFITYAYNGSYVPLYVYGPRYHVPIISFTFGSYWDRWYRDRPWYRDRDHWAHYDWRRRDWDNDRWRTWANDHRHDYDRDRANWDRNRHDNDRRDNDRRDNDRRDRDHNWRGDNNDHQWNGNWNGRSNVRTDNSRRPGAPVQGNVGSNFRATDPSVHSGANVQTNVDRTRDNNRGHDNNRVWSGDRNNNNNNNRAWSGNNNNRPDTRQFHAVQPNGGNNQRNVTVERHDNTPKNQHVDQPRNNDRGNQRNVQNNKGQDKGGDHRGRRDRDNDG